VRKNSSENQKVRNSSNYQELGWRHELWDVVRYFRSLGRGAKRQSDFLKEYLGEETALPILVQGKGANKFEIHGSVPLKRETIELFFKYLKDSEKQFVLQKSNLRSEDEALSFCEKIGVAVRKTSTKNLDHHQSSKSLVGAVTKISSEIAQKYKLSIDVDPQHRCVWFKEKHLYVTARNLDGAIPCLVNPFLVWEIKEYWGKTLGGSKMSDAVYECLLVGRELREYEEKRHSRIHHAVFIDGNEQWESRESDFIRFIDLYNQGIIDELIVGKDVESKWEKILIEIIMSSEKN
jgi:hypothetical protein